MALTIEDGTGKSNADSYLSLADLKTWATSRGRTAVDDSDDDVLEAKLREATEYIDAQFRFKGSRLKATQSLEWPRAGVNDWGGLAVTGVPLRVRNACADLACRALSESLFQDAARGGKVVSESVGAISVTYAADAPAGKLWAAAHALLAQYVDDRNRPSMTGPVTSGLPAQLDAGYFSLTTHDTPGSSS